MTRAVHIWTIFSRVRKHSHISLPSGTLSPIKSGRYIANIQHCEAIIQMQLYNKSNYDAVITYTYMTDEMRFIFAGLSLFVNNTTRKWLMKSVKKKLFEIPEVFPTCFEKCLN